MKVAKRLAAYFRMDLAEFFIPDKHDEGLSDAEKSVIAAMRDSGPDGAKVIAAFAQGVLQTHRFAQAR